MVRGPLPMGAWRRRGLIPAALLLGRAGAEIGACDFGPRALPSSAEDFARLAAELAGETSQAESSQGAAGPSSRLPEQPLAFDLASLPPSLEGLVGEAAVLRHLRKTTWPWRGDNHPAETHVPLEEHIAGKSNGDPLYVSQYVNDSKLRRVFQTVPPALRGVRRLPIAVFARPSEGLRLHSLPEPRWLLQLHGRTLWRLARPEDAATYPPIRACGPQVEGIAGTCELRPNSMIYVPGNWGWGSCMESSGEGVERFSLAVGAGGYSRGWPDLFHLIAEGKIKQVEEQLQEDSKKVHEGDPTTSMTPMDLSAQIGDLKMAKLLTKYGGRPNDTASTTMLFPLHYAALYAHVDVVQWLLDQGADASSRSAEGYHPLHYAAEGGHLPIVDALINARANLHAATSAKAAPAHLATGAGHLAVLRRLRDAGAELSTVDGHGCDPTIWAAKRGDARLLSFLIDDEGLSKDVRCDKRETVAHYAAQLGHIAILDLLKERKADFTAKNDRKHTPLHVAVEGSVIPVIDWFARAGLKKISPRTPGLLHLAAWRGRIQSMEALLRHGADVNALDPSTKSPAIEFASSPQVYDFLASRQGGKMPEGWVHRASGRGQLDLLRKLVPGQREMELQLSEPHDGVYPVHLAAQSGHREVLKWLCGQMGASCSAKSSSKSYGRTAAHFACVGGAQEDASAERTRLEILKYLVVELKLGAGDKDDLGVTPVELAGVSGHLTLVQWLLNDQRVSSEGLWYAKRSGALNATVDKWVTNWAPRGMYDNWLRIGHPDRKPAKRRRRRRKEAEKEL